MTNKLTNSIQSMIVDCSVGLRAGILDASPTENKGPVYLQDQWLD